MLRMMVIALAMLAQVAAAQAQSPDLSRFKAFADGLVGAWSVDIRETDAEGKVIWSDTQRRVFEYRIAKEFLEERTYVTSKRTGKDVDISLHIYGYDPKANDLSMHGYWVGRPGQLFAVTTKLDDDNRFARGAMDIVLEDGSRSHQRYEMGWIDDARFIHRAYRKTPDGREYLGEQLIYVRVAEPQP